MLSAADAELVRRDPGVPGLERLLDPQAFLELLRQLMPERNFESARPTYLRYKHATNCLVAYQVRQGDEVVRVHAKAHGTDSSTKLQKALAQQPGSPAPRVFTADAGIVVSLFPHDRKLPMLARIATPEERNTLLRKVVPDRPDLWDAELSDLRYKPERRYVARVGSGEAPSAAVKFYADADFALASSATKRLQSRDRLRLATRIGSFRRGRVLALEWLRGESLDLLALTESSDCNELDAVGAALAELHAQQERKLPARTPGREVQTLREQAVAIACLCPELRESAAQLVERIATSLEAEPDRTLHGDFYDDQVMLAGDRIALVDLDTAARGPAKLDLGSFVARLQARRISGELPSSRTATAIDAFLEGYQRESAETLSELGTYTALALVRIALEPFRSRDPRWPERCAQLVACASELLPGDSPGVRPTSIARAGRRPVPVKDPHGAGADPALGFLDAALDVEAAEQHLAALPLPALRHSELQLREIRVVRHKPGRRCLIEYDVDLCSPGQPPETLTLLGKCRARGLDEHTHTLVTLLWQRGFANDAPDEVVVPEPLGTIPQFHMWLQQLVPGKPATELLDGAGGIELARRIAHAIHKLHTTDVPTRRRHDVATELKILREGFQVVAGLRPEWESRLERLGQGCERIASLIAGSRMCGIHRDFYPDQLIVDGSRLVLLDLDLHCAGDPALDVGNFAAHLIEQGLRERGDATAFDEQIAALTEGYLALSAEVGPRDLTLWTVLSLARHVFISTRIAPRRPFTEAILDRCELLVGGIR